MGIIMGAIGGLGEGMQSNAKMLADQAMEDKRTNAATGLAQMQSSLALQREQALAQFKVGLEDSQREKMSDEIGEARQGIVNGAIGKKYAQSDAAVASADAGDTDAPLTDDQRAAIAQSKQIDTDKGMTDPDTYIQAATETGYIDPKTTATVNQRGQAAEMRAQAIQDRLATLQAMNTQTNETRAEIAQLREASRNNGKIDTATGRMMITSLDADMKVAFSQQKALQEQFSMARKADKPALLEKINALDDDIKQIRQQKQSFFEQMGTAPAKGGSSSSNSSDANAPVGVRQNNPGNIRNADGNGFQSYASPKEGFDALKGQLLRYAKGQTTGKPLDTVQDIISTWAPASDNNDTAGYVKQVAADLGVDPDKPLNLTTSPATLLALSSAISRHEVGPKYAEAFINPPRSTMPAPPQIAGLPAGAKQIGTSGGKPVFQTPDGKRFIQGQG